MWCTTQLPKRLIASEDNMLTNLMEDQQKRLVRQIQARPHNVDPEVVMALALLDILDILGDIRDPLSGDKPQDS